MARVGFTPTHALDGREAMIERRWPGSSMRPAKVSLSFADGTATTVNAEDSRLVALSQLPVSEAEPQELLIKYAGPVFEFSDEAKDALRAHVRGEELWVPRVDDNEPDQAHALVDFITETGCVKCPPGLLHHIITVDEIEDSGFVVNVSIDSQPGLMLSAGWVNGRDIYASAELEAGEAAVEGVGALVAVLNDVLYKAEGVSL